MLFGLFVYFGDKQVDWFTQALTGLGINEAGLLWSGNGPVGLEST